MTEPALAPLQILASMIAELGKMRKVIEEADVLRPRVKRAERFIKQFATTWNLPLPDGAVPVRTNPRPEGIEVQEEGDLCSYPGCGRRFTTRGGLAHHRTVSHSK